jgi:signal transduction histidine kinase
MTATPALTAPRPFHLLRWFAAVSAVVIALIALTQAWLVSSFLTERLYRREAEVSRDILQSLLVSPDVVQFLANPQDTALRERFKATVTQLGQMQDVLRANVWAPDGSVLWSTNKSLVGRRFTDNDEMFEAARGDLVVEPHQGEEPELEKREYAGLSKQHTLFVEIYVPVHAPESKKVLGVVELYKAPMALQAAVHDANWRIGFGALGGAVLLFGSLFWLVRRADATMRRQQHQLLEAETFAAIGELAASVAHNIRNPLASIRSSAELSLEAPQEHGAEAAGDILREVDRISERINELLRLATPPSADGAPIDLLALVRSAVDEQRVALARRGLGPELESALERAPVRADLPLIGHVLRSLISNASEAMKPGQTCRFVLHAGPPGMTRLELQDPGAGMDAATQAQVFRPFFTTKPQGLGLGLSLARRVVERLGGQLNLSSAPGQGTTVSLDLPNA